MDATVIITLLETVKNHFEELKLRIENYQDNPWKIEELGKQIDLVERDLHRLRQIINDVESINHPDYQEHLKSRMLVLKCELSNVIMAQEELAGTLGRFETKSKLHLKLRDFFKANTVSDTVNEVLTELIKVGETVSSLLHTLNGLYATTPRRDAFRADFSTAPPLGNHLFLDFNDETSTEGRLKRALLEQGKARDAFVTAAIGAFRATAVAGLGGVGKTTALMGLCRDTEVQNLFPDGVYFISVGKDASDGHVIGQLQLIIKQSGGHTKGNEAGNWKSLDLAIRETAKWFHGRKVLFICDDLWPTRKSDKGYLTVFKQLCIHAETAHLVVSTRDRTLVDDVEKKIEFDKLDDEKSLVMLRGYAGITDAQWKRGSDEDRASVAYPLKECQGLPLTIGIAGKMIREKTRGSEWSKAAREFRNLLHPTSKGDIKTEMHSRGLGDYPSLNKTISASIEMLEGYFVKYCEDRGLVKVDLRELLYKLSVLRKQARVSDRVLCKLWQLSQGHLVKHILEKFYDYCIVLKEETSNGWTFGLHDLVLDYARCVAMGNGQYLKFHLMFLAQFQNIVIHDASRPDRSTDSRCSKGTIEEPDRWWDIVRNVDRDVAEYLSSNLVWHLIESGRVDQGVYLLSDARWVRKRIEDRNLPIAIGEYGYVLGGLQSRNKFGEHPEDNKDAGDICLIRNFLSTYWSSLTNDCMGLATRIHETLQNIPGSGKGIERLLKTARYVAPRVWYRPVHRIRSIPASEESFIHEAHCRIKSLAVDWENDIIFFTKDGFTSQIFWLDMNTRKESMLKISSSITFKLASSSDSASVFIAANCLEGIRKKTDDGNWSSICNQIMRDIPSGLQQKLRLLSLPISYGIYLPTCMAASKDGKIAVAESVHELDMWDVESGKPIGRPMTGHTLKVTSVAISANGKRVVSGSYDGTVRIWDTESGTQVGKRACGHTRTVSSVAISADGKIAVSGSYDRTVRIWEAGSGTSIGRPMYGHTRRVTCVAISADGGRAVSGSFDGTVRMWNTETGTPIGKAMSGHILKVTRVAISADGRRVVSGSDDRTVRMWDAERDTKLTEPLLHHDISVNSVAISADGRTVISGSDDKAVRMWDVESGTSIERPMYGHTHRVTSVAVSSDGRRAASGSVDGTVRTWNTESGTQNGKPIYGHTGTVTSVAISGDGKRIVSGSDDRTVKMWNAESGTSIGRPMYGHTRKVTSVAISAESRRAVSGSVDGTVRIWDTESGLPVGRPMSGHIRKVTSVAISADGRRVVSGSDDKTVRMWDAENGTPIGKPMSGHTDYVTSVAISAAGKRVVSGSYDRTVRMWDAESCTPIGEPLLHHDVSFNSVAISADGKKIVSGSFDQTVRMWDAEGGSLIGGPIFGRIGEVTSVGRSADGRIVAGSSNHKLLIWAVEIDTNGS